MDGRGGVSVRHARPISRCRWCPAISRSPSVLSRVVASKSEVNGCLTPRSATVRAKLAFPRLAHRISMSASRSAVFGHGRGLPFGYYISVQRGPNFFNLL